AADLEPPKVRYAGPVMAPAPIALPEPAAAAAPPPAALPAAAVPSTPPPTTPTAWSPLRNRLFRWLWIASLASNVGTWLQHVGAACVMASLTRAPTLVALVQAATSLPAFLLALPSGALADVLDRRRLLLFTQAWMAAAAGVLGILTLTGGAGPGALL